MPIIPEKPIVVPEKSFDRLWVTFLSVDSPKVSAANSLPSPDASAVIRLLPYNSQTLEVGEDTLTLPIADIFSRMAHGDVKLQQILGLILEYAQDEAKRQGLI